MRVGDPPTLTSQSPAGTYQIVITNVGSDAITEVEVTEPLPDDLAYVDSSPSPSTEGQKVVWNFKYIAAGEEREIKVTVRLTRTLKPGEEYEPKQRTIINYTDSEGKRHTLRPK
ncbi:MAG TPA: hypothetical protein VGC61_05705 [Pyrinomonadaceae bacterium]